MYNKEGRLKLETTAHYVPIGSTDIKFYNSDIGTSDLVFYITRNKRPLEVSNENVDCYVILKAKDGTYIVDNASVEEPLNGKVRYTIPKEFLTHVGKVKGQVYIAVHGKEDIITEVDFSFEIKDGLLSTIPSVDKVNYIRTFDELRERIIERTQYIEEALENGEDYVTQMDETFQSGMKSLNDRTREVISQLENNAIAYGQALADVKDNAVSEIDEKGNQIKTDIEQLNQYDTSNWQKYKMTESNGFRIRKSDIDPKELDAGFYQMWRMKNAPVGNDDNAQYWNVDITNGETQTKQIVATISASGEMYKKQIHKDEDKGWERINAGNKRTWLGTIGSESSEYDSVLDIPAGLYECSIPADAFEVDAPLDPNGSGYIAELDITEGAAGKRKQIRLLASSRNNEYLANLHTATDDEPNGRFTGWKRVMNAEEFEGMNTDTGWIEWTTKNGATKRNTDDDKSIHCHYRVVETNGKKQIYVRVNVNNIESGMVIGSIPKEYVPKTQNYYIRTPVTMNPAVILFATNGDMRVYMNTNDIDKWIPSHYIYGELNWIIDDEGSGV